MSPLLRSRGCHIDIIRYREDIHRVEVIGLLEHTIEVLTVSFNEIGHRMSNSIYTREKSLRYGGNVLEEVFTIFICNGTVEVLTLPRVAVKGIVDTPHNSVLIQEAICFFEVESVNSHLKRYIVTNEKTLR